MFNESIEALLGLSPWLVFIGAAVVSELLWQFEEHARRRREKLPRAVVGRTSPALRGAKPSTGRR